MFKSYTFDSVRELMNLVNNGVKVTAAAIPPGGGGTGYELGDVLTILDGPDLASATLEVSGVAAGVITAVTVKNPGAYFAAPSNPVSVSGGKGSGASFNLTTAAAISGQSDIADILNRNGQWYLGYWT
jgi:hypothetical protein